MFLVFLLGLLSSSSFSKLRILLDVEVLMSSVDMLLIIVGFGIVLVSRLFNFFISRYTTAMVCGVVTTWIQY